MTTNNYYSNVKPQRKNIEDGDEIVFSQEMGLDNNYPFPWLYEYYQGINKRRIFITKDIDDSLVEEQKLILRWNYEDEQNNIPIKDREKIVIYLYSYGGDGNMCLSFIDTLKLSRTPIVMCCLGIAMSAGAMIFISAPKGHRYIFPNGTILLHQGSSSSGGTAQQVLDQAEDYKHFLNRMKEMTLESTNISAAMYNKKAKKEWYIYADEAVKLGCADKIVTDIRDIL